MRSELNPYRRASEVNDQIREILDMFTPNDQPYRPPELAQRVVAYLKRHDPNLLSEWLDLHAVNLVRDMINHRDRSARAHARATSGRRVFQNILEEYQLTGNRKVITNWLDTVYQVADGSKKHLREMGSSDLKYAARDYEISEIENGLMKQFLRALGNRITSDGETVEDYYTEEQLREMWNSITRNYR